MKDFFKSIGAAVLVVAMMAMLGYGFVVAGRGPIVYSAADGSRCYVEVVEKGELKQYPCTGRFRNAASDDSLEQVNIAPAHLAGR